MGAKWEIIDYWEAFEELQRYISQQQFEYVFLDVETNSKIENNALLWGIGLSFGKEESFYIPFRDKNSILQWTDEHIKIISDWVIYICHTKKLVGYNIIYDVLVLLYNWKVDLAPYIYSDPILQKHLLDEERPFGLKETAVKYLGAWADKAQERLHANIEANGGTTTKDEMQMWKADTEVLAEYCCNDVILTQTLFFLFEENLEKESLLALFYEEETMPLYREVTIPMKQRGFNVDAAYFEKLLIDITHEINKVEWDIIQTIKPHTTEFVTKLLSEEYPMSRKGGFPKYYAKLLQFELPRTDKGNITLAAKEMAKFPQDSVFMSWYNGQYELTSDEIDNIRLSTWREHYPDQKYVFNLKSNNHLKWLFFEKLGFKPLGKTDGGEPQVDDDFLESVKQSASWVEMLLDYKRLNKLKSTYIEGILERQIDGIIYAGFLQFGTTSGRFSSVNPNLQNIPRVKEDDAGLSQLVLTYVNAIKRGFIAPPGYLIVNADYCLHPKTELLTKRGWVNVLLLLETDEVWQIEPNSLAGSWVVPIRLVKRHYSGEIYSFGNRRGHLEVTENHTMLWVGQDHKTRPDKLNYRKITKSQELIPNTGSNFSPGSLTTSSKSTFSKEEIWIACMAQADSNHITDFRYRIQVSLPRKREKVRELLQKNGAVYEIRESQNLEVESWCFSFNSPLLSGKVLNVDLIGSNQIDILIEALCFWDGSKRNTTKGRFVWGSTNKEQAELVQGKLVREGYEARLSVRYYENKNHNTFYYLQIKKLGRIRVRKNDVKKYKYEGMVGCVTVENGFILVRSEGQTFVTGNCQLEPCAFSEASGDKKLQSVFNNKQDLYSSIAINVWGLHDCSADKKDPNFLKNKYPEYRQKAKIIALAVVYGAEAGRIASTLGVTYKEAQEIIDSYLDAYPGLKQYMMDCNKQVCFNGFVTSKFGRKRRLYGAKAMYTQYGNNIFNKKWCNSNGAGENYWKFKNYLNLAKNHPIQSVAAHIVNRAAIAINREFKKNGIDGVIIAQVHDELTCVVKEEQALQAKDIMRDCMQNTTKISVPLIAEPLIAKNWAEAK